MGIISASRLRASVNTNAFIIEVDTSKTGVSNNNQFQFTGAEGNYDVVAKQNDIVVATFDNLSGEQTITLPSSGIYVLEVSAKEANGFNRIRFNTRGDRNKIVDIKQWGNILWRSMDRAFFGCFNLSVSATDSPDLRNCTTLQQMFQDAKNANPATENWDVSNIRDFSSMFYDSGFNNIVNNWNTSSGIEMKNIFIGTPFNQPLNNWDVSNVTDMKNMFLNASSFNQDLSEWCVTNIASEPSNFDTGANSWVLPNSRPIWGTCP
jgi:hypothetical protein